VRVSYLADGMVSDARRLAAGAAAVAGAWIALGIFFGTVLVRRFTLPLTEMALAADALSAGDRIEVSLATDPELAELAAAFNRMSSRLRDSQGEMQKLIASLNERVALATAEGLKTERLATLGAIAAGFAHEMGNSLNVIAGFTAVVLREVPEGDVHRRDLETVKRETARAAGLLERFLFFARARAARSQPQRVEPIVRESVELVAPAAATAHVTTEVAVEPGLPEVRCDAEVLLQAFVNLGVNAVQAMEGGGRLTVRATKHDGDVWVEFQDTGRGMDASVRDHIFEPFFTTKASGTGLGLAIVRQAAEANGGSVEVESAPGAGALFRVRLPAAEAA
jgi:signal transduction histidine kinase